MWWCNRVGNYDEHFYLLLQAFVTYWLVWNLTFDMFEQGTLEEDYL